jgi:GAF domain-containing protein
VIDLLGQSDEPARVTTIEEDEARRALALLAEEQSALRRVAMLVAEESSPLEIFGAVTEEACRVLGSEAVGLLRFDPDDTATLLAQSQTPWDPPPVGTRLPLDGENVVTQVLRTRQIARVDDWTSSTGAIAGMATALGVRSAVAAPVVVEGSLWGTIIAATSQIDALPVETESRLEQFTGLVATAIANAAARGALSLLAEEQAALRRVAMLVAQQPSPEEIFTAVTEAVGSVVGADMAAMVVFPDDVAGTVVATWSRGGPMVPIGSPLPLDSDSAVARIFHSGAAARVDSYAPGAGAEIARKIGVRSTVGAPILVRGKLWGALAAAVGGDGELADDCEARISGFTELVATAVSNAQAREELQRLADEQAALRRVATLVAKGVGPEGVFAAVAEEVGRLLPVDSSTMARFGPDETLITLASWSATGPGSPVGMSWPLEGTNVGLRVLQTGEAARIDDFSAATGPIGVAADEAGIKSAVGSPIVVEGRLWGVLTARSTEGSLPPGTETRLSSFTELVATAIANAEARDALRQLADEQAALRRVATLVADGSGPEGVFPAVAAEVDVLFGADISAIVRFEEDGAATVLGDVGGPHTTEKRVALDPGYVVDRVRERRRSARFDTDDPTAADMPSLVRTLGIRSAVASPIVVDGELWGAITAASLTGPLASSAERRLTEFTELVATAVANTQAGERVTALVEEQTALRRVATLVAENASPDELFRGVTVEVGTLLDADFSGMARIVDDGVRPLATWASEGEHPPLPALWPMDPGDPVTAVAKAGHAVRWDDWALVPGPIAAFIRDELGVRSTVGTPIVVEGRFWGVLAVHSKEPLPQDSVSRLEQFSDLVSTALANAEARAEVGRLAQEQAALRRVATLVAHDAPYAEVFEAVAAEVGEVLDASLTVLGRYDSDGSATAIGSWGSSAETIPVGTRAAIGGRNVLTAVAETGMPARLDDYEHATGESAEIARRYGWHSTIAAPITVEGRVWGVMMAMQSVPFPAGDEERLAQFTDLVATAIGNTQAQVAVQTAAQEQGALRRVATLVAASAAPSEVFAAVINEIALVLGADACMLCRVDPDGAAVVVGTWADGSPEPALGTRILRGGTNLITIVLGTGRPARMDSYLDAQGPASEFARTYGLRSAVGAPILVEGRLWGLVVAGTTHDEPLAPDAEQRLVGFTELVATAIANAQAHDDLTTLAEQQAALRRVATVVAQRATPEVVFWAVAREAGGLLGADLSVLVRLESDDTVTVMAGPSYGPHEPGERVPIDPRFVVEAVRKTGRPARFETDDPTAEGMPEIVRSLGVRSAVASPVVVEGALWGAIIVGSLDESLPTDLEQRLGKFTELVATGISNATARAELLASRARIVAAGDEARRRIERNLHDGTQQRLVTLGFAVRAAEAGLLPEQDDVRAQLSGVATGLVGAIEDLQEISRGIHPAILSKGGLAPALQALAHRSAIPVDLVILADERIAEPIEVAAYFVASEALANAAKYSQASRIDVLLQQCEQSLLLSISDDGVGGAEAARGSGLVGLTDRVEALGGSIRVTSRPGEGTQITAEFPRELSLPQPAG